MRKVGYFILSLWILTGTSCTTPPPAPPVDPAEVNKKDRTVGLELAHDLEKKIHFKQEPEVQIYLRTLAKKLEDSTPELKDASVGVLLAKEHETDSNLWRDYGLPGNRIYLSVNLLKNFQYENEIAAMIAFELAHILKRHVVERLDQVSSIRKTDKIEDKVSNDVGFLPNQKVELPEKVEFFGPAGIFSFSEETQLEAVEDAVGIMYRAGYDARGLVAVFNFYRDHSDKSPFEPGTVLRMLESARKALAAYSPLRNPVVRSEAFMSIQKRIQKL